MIAHNLEVPQSCDSFVSLMIKNGYVLLSVGKEAINKYAAGQPVESGTHLNSIDGISGFNADE